MSFPRHVPMNKLSFNFDAAATFIATFEYLLSHIFYVLSAETFPLPASLFDLIFYVIRIMIDFIAFNSIENRLSERVREWRRWLSEIGRSLTYWHKLINLRGWETAAVESERDSWWRELIENLLSNRRGE
jgi:hypothetical protein